jgi:uncharacterized protein (DUF433 family)
VTEIVPGITADPARVFGKPVIGGTRVPAATVLGLLAAGRPEVEILAEYDLTTEQIRAVFRITIVEATRVRVFGGSDPNGT